MHIKIDSYSELESYVQTQLKKGQAYGVDTFYQAALNAKEAIAAAASHSQKMAAVARYGAVVKRWHHMLIVHITHVALKNAVLSRTNVRNWQQAVFGKSMDSKELRIYADTSRSHGDKIPRLSTDDPCSQEAASMFAKYRNQLKLV